MGKRLCRGIAEGEWIARGKRRETVPVWSADAVIPVNMFQIPADRGLNILYINGQIDFKIPITASCRATV